MSNTTATAGNKGEKDRSDCFVSLQLTSSGGIAIDLTSKVEVLFGEVIKTLCLEVLHHFGIENPETSPVRANHPVQRLEDGVVEITSMNHGFAVDNSALPDTVEETHVSLFDGSNCGIAVKGKRAFGVQYHPEASPGPQDSFYLFEKFVGMLG